MENLNVVELKQNELQEIEGGIFLEMLAAAALGVALNAIMENPRGVLDGMVDALT